MEDPVRNANEAAPPHDAQPNPEPSVPSLTEPDPGVFHHAPRDLKDSAPTPERA